MNLISVSELVKQSWQLYKNNFKSFFSVIIWLLPFVVVLSILETINKATANSYSGLYSLITIADIIAVIVVNIVLIEAINKFYHNESVDIQELVKPAIYKAVGYVWIVILVSLLVILGFFLLVIPGIILGIWYSFAEQVFILENTRGYSALKRSKELVKGYWWPVFWRWLGPTLFFGLIIVIVSAIILVPTITLLGSSRESVGPDTTTLYKCGSLLSACISNTMNPVSTLMFNLYGGIVGVIVTPLFTALGIILYNNLKQVNAASPKTQPIAS